MQGRRKQLRAKRNTVSWLWVVPAVLITALAGQPAFALGLGEARVQSYLQSPLDVRIKLITRSEAELATVTASLASAEDFRVIGLNRAAISVPLDFMVVADMDDPHIRVRSQLPVNEPVVQLVVEVVWASGRMLRQYTLFLDPPLSPSVAPLPATSRPVEAVASAPPVSVATPDSAVEPGTRPGPEPETRLEQDPVAETPLPAQPQAELLETPVPDAPAIRDSGPPFDPAAGVTEQVPEAVDETGIAAARDVEAEPPVDVAATDAPADEPPEAVEDPPMAEAEAVATPSEPAADDAPAVQSPPREPAFRVALPDPQSPAGDNITVQRGDTLWSIAAQWSRQHGGTVNQVMLAIQQQNPGAFNRGNINSLRAGAVLRMPGSQQVAMLDAGAATREVLRQEDIYLNHWGDPGSAQEPPLLASLPVAPPPSGATESEAPVDELAGRLELVPPGEAEDELATGTTGDGTAEAGESVVEELARTQEELANAQQENVYLNERISELEAELERRTQGGVADANLAELEQRLREDRQSGAGQAELAVVPPSSIRPWYARLTPWVIGFALLVLGGVVWWLRTRSSAGVGQDALDAIAEEAEGILRVLDEEPATAARGDNVVTLGSTRKAPTAADGSVISLDPEDPETKLEMARAYLSVGETDAARPLLQEVLDTGSAEQAAAARDLLKEL